MGCNNTRNIIYNEYDHYDLSNPKKLSGPFIYPSTNYEEVENYYKNKTYIGELLTIMESKPKKDCMGFRKPLSETETEKSYTFYSNEEILKMSRNFAYNSIKNQLTEKKKFDEGAFEFFGIFSKNCVEWIVTDIACQLNSITTATFYATLGDVAFDHICKQTELSTIAISPDNISTFIKYKNKYGLNHIKNIILFDKTLYVKEGLLEELQKTGLKVHSFRNMVKFEGDEKQFNLNFSGPDTILTLCYTSGTTNLPKGAKLSQRSFISQMCALPCTGVTLSEDDVHLSYLPLAHVMERLGCLLSLFFKVKIGFLSGDIKKTFLEDMEILKPTYLVAVPRVLNTFKQLIYSNFEKLESGCKKSLVEKGIRVKKENIEHGEVTHAFYDSLVFNKVKDKFGGRIRFIIAGSAPLPKDLADDIKILLCCPIIEGYGMTECCGAATFCYISDTSNNSTGGAIKSCKIKLVDVPEMNYHSETMLNGENSPTGEICVKSFMIFSGYFRNPEETKKMIDDEGWLHTGDVGRIMPGDRGLKIIDRIKEIFKLSQGEYIAPSKLESIYMKSKYVMQICIYGNSQKSFLIAIIVPNKLNVIEFLKKKEKINKDGSNYSELLKDKELIDEIAFSLDKLAKESDLNSLEKIHKFIITEKEFTIENGCLTPTMKLIRKKLEQEFIQEIKEIYS